MVQEDLDAEKDRVISSETPTEVRQCSFSQSRFLPLPGLLPNLRTQMHSAAKFQFERVVREFAEWRAVSPAPAWWWQPAFAQQEEMPPLCRASAVVDICRRRRCANGSSR
jgi:hypothetical protein